MNIKSIVFGVVIILLLILIIRYLFSRSTKIDGMKDAKKVTKISADDIDSSNSNNYAYSCWIYIDDWSYRYGEPKIVLGRLDQGLEPSPSITLGAIENNLKVAVSCYPESGNTGKGMVHNCNVANIPLQKWVNIIVSLYGRTLDVYIDGKLVRTCVLPGVAKIANNAPIYVTPLGGFSGFTSNVHYYNDALNPQEAFNIYKAGPGGTGLQFPYSIKVTFLKDEEEQGSVEI